MSLKLLVGFAAAFVGFPSLGCTVGEERAANEITSGSSIDGLDRTNAVDVATRVADLMFSRQMEGLVDFVPPGHNRDLFQNVVEISGGGVVTAEELFLLSESYSSEGDRVVLIFGGKFCQVDISETIEAAGPTSTTSYGSKIGESGSSLGAGPSATPDAVPSESSGAPLNCIEIDSVEDPRILMTTFNLEKDDTGTWWLSSESGFEGAQDD